MMELPIAVLTIQRAWVFLFESVAFMPHHDHTTVEAVGRPIAISSDTEDRASHQRTSSPFQRVFIVGSSISIDIHERYSAIEILRDLRCHVQPSYFLAITVAIPYLLQWRSLLADSLCGFLGFMVILVLFTVACIPGFLLRELTTKANRLLSVRIVREWVMNLRLFEYWNFLLCLTITTVMKVFNPS